jgi:hypothetical protein
VSITKMTWILSILRISIRGSGKENRRPPAWAPIVVGLWTIVWIM